MASNRKWRTNDGACGVGAGAGPGGWTTRRIGRLLQLLVTAVAVTHLLAACGGGGGGGNDGATGGGDGATGDADDNTEAVQSAAVRFLSGRSVEVLEGVAAIDYKVKAQAEDAEPADFAYGIAGGADAMHLRLDDDGFLHFVYPDGLDYEDPVDADNDNVYEVEVIARHPDGARKRNTVEVAVTDSPEFLDYRLDVPGAEWIDPIGADRTDAAKPRTVRLAWRPDEALAAEAHEFVVGINGTPRDQDPDNFARVADRWVASRGTAGEWHYIEVERPLHRVRWEQEQYRIYAVAANGEVVDMTPAIPLAEADATAMIGYPPLVNPGMLQLVDEPEVAELGFGEAVAVSGNGEVMAVATRGHIPDGTSTTHFHLCRVFVDIWRHDGNGWSRDLEAPVSFEWQGTQACKDDRLGVPSLVRPVSLSLDDEGRTLAVGLPQAKLAVTDTCGNPETAHLVAQAGRVAIMARDYGSLAGEGGDGEPLADRAGWSLVEWIDSHIPQPAERFGRDVDLSGDGAVLVVGAPYADGLPDDRCDSVHDQTGNAYVYTRGYGEDGLEPNRDVWHRGGTLWPRNEDRDRLTDREPRGDNAFRGRKVAVNGDGSLIALTQGSRDQVLEDGVPPKPEIQLYERSRSAGRWVYADYWRPPVENGPDGGQKSDFRITDVELLSVPNGQYSGEWIAVGTPGEDYGCPGVRDADEPCMEPASPNSGSVYIASVANVGGADDHDAAVVGRKAYQVKPVWLAAEEEFGAELALAASADGERLFLAVGAPGQAGAKTGVVTHTRDRPIAGHEDTGALDVYVGDTGTLGGLTHRNRVKASNPHRIEAGNRPPRFGYSVDFGGHGDTLLVGAPFADSVGRPVLPFNWGVEGSVGNDDGGAAYMY